MRAKEDFRDDGRLEIARGDLITIVDGCAQNYWWKGQNKRTLLVGKFPRAILDPERKLCSDDISAPLRNSFVHTGHMGADMKAGRSWGNPAAIDEIFLRNPLKPPDLLDDIDETETETTMSNYKAQATNAVANTQDVLLIDLSDTMPSSDLKVSYPDTVASNKKNSIQSSTSSSSSSLADLAGLETSLATTLFKPIPQFNSFIPPASTSSSSFSNSNNNQYYVNNQYMSQKLVKMGAAEAPARTYYNDVSNNYFYKPQMSSLMGAQTLEFNRALMNPSSGVGGTYANAAAASLFMSAYQPATSLAASSGNSTNNFKSTNPFYMNQNSYQQQHQREPSPPPPPLPSVPPCDYKPALQPTNNESFTQFRNYQSNNIQQVNNNQNSTAQSSTTAMRTKSDVGLYQNASYTSGFVNSNNNSINSGFNTIIRPQTSAGITTACSSSNLTVDDLLSKVMNDVMNDFENYKS